MLGDHEVDPAQDLELAERLVQALDPQGLGGHLAAPTGARRRSRATSQSTTWINGIVTTMNTRATPISGVKL